MQVDPATGEAFVVPGNEGALLADFTDMLYRVGGNATGAAPVIDFRAGGNLDIQEASPTDFSNSPIRTTQLSSRRCMQRRVRRSFSE